MEGGERLWVKGSKWSDWFNVGLAHLMWGVMGSETVSEGVSTTLRPSTPFFPGHSFHHDLTTNSKLDFNHHHPIVRAFILSTFLTKQYRWFWHKHAFLEDFMLHIHTHHEAWYYAWNTINRCLEHGTSMERVTWWFIFSFHSISQSYEGYRFTLPITLEPPHRLQMEWGMQSSRNSVDEM